MAEKKTSPSSASTKTTKPKSSGAFASLEESLDGIFREKAPFQIPEKGRDGIVKYSPWIALVIGIFGLLASLSLWQAAHRVNQLVDVANQFSATYGGHTTAAHLGVSFWLSLILLVVTSVIALVAFPGLKARKKTGWNLLFYSTLLNLAYGVVALFYDGGGVASLIGSLLGTAIGLYFLFQIRSHYKA